MPARSMISAMASAAAVVAITLIPNGGFPESLPMQVRQWDDAAAFIDANGASLVVANPLDGSFSPVRDALGYYLRESSIVEPLQGDVEEGSEVFYVRRAGGAPEIGLEIETGDPVEFGEVKVFRQVWTGSGLVPAP
ncbi:MAG TPA: hypothetical protein ENH15_02770 [Actinobacteria bacterium]|nr:hypothetical protein [Actinomycetota bacterium]